MFRVWASCLGLNEADSAPFAIEVPVFMRRYTSCLHKLLYIGLRVKDLLRVEAVSPCMYIYIYMCVCVYIYIYIYTCVCTSVSGSHQVLMNEGLQAVW